MQPMRRDSVRKSRDDHFVVPRALELRLHCDERVRVAHDRLDAVRRPPPKARPVRSTFAASSVSGPNRRGTSNTNEHEPRARAHLLEQLRRRRRAVCHHEILAGGLIVTTNPSRKSRAHSRGPRMRGTTDATGLRAGTIIESDTCAQIRSRSHDHNPRRRDRPKRREGAHLDQRHGRGARHRGGYRVLRAFLTRSATTSRSMRLRSSPRSCRSSCAACSTRAGTQPDTEHARDIDSFLTTSRRGRVGGRDRSLVCGHRAQPVLRRHAQLVRQQRAERAPRVPGTSVLKTGKPGAGVRGRSHRRPTRGRCSCSPVSR